MPPLRPTDRKVRTPVIASFLQLVGVLCGLQAVWANDGALRAFWILCAVCCFFGPPIFLSNINRHQDERDALAEQIIAIAAADSLVRDRYIVCLRSFSVSAQMLEVTTRDTRWSPFRMPPGETEQIVSVETALIDALWSYAPVIGLDRDKSDFGMGRATVADNAWEQTVERLMINADSIVLIPGVTPGLKQEYSLLRKFNLLNKTLLIMPPSDDGNLEAWTELWCQASNVAISELGVKLPPYRSTGLIFAVDGSGDLEAAIPFPQSMTTEAIAAHLRKFRTHLAQADGKKAG